MLEVRLILHYYTYIQLFYFIKADAKVTILNRGKLDCGKIIPFKSTFHIENDSSDKTTIANNN